MFDEEFVRQNLEFVDTQDGTLLYVIRASKVLPDIHIEAWLRWKFPGIAPETCWFAGRIQLTGQPIGVEHIQAVTDFMIRGVLQSLNEAASFGVSEYTQ